MARGEPLRDVFKFRERLGRYVADVGQLHGVRLARDGAREALKEAAASHLDGAAFLEDRARELDHRATLITR